MQNHVVLFYPRFNTEHSSGPPKDLRLPMSILFLAPALMNRGLKVSLIDGRVDDYSARVEALNGDILLCGVSCLTPQIEQGLEFSKFVKRTDSGIPIVWGGWHATIDPENTAAHPSIDFVVKGEGEETLVELCQCLKDHRDVRSLEGIVYKNEEHVVNNPDHPRSKQFTPTSLPYDLLNLSAYDLPGGTVDYVSSRGCPHRCGFCSIGRHCRVWKGLKAEEVVSDLRRLNSAFGVTHIRFLDDNFFANPGRVKEICRLLTEAGLGITWECNGHVNELRLLDQETLKLARRAGIRLLTIGIESGSRKTIEFIKKDYDPREVLPLLQRLHQESIPFCSNFIVGFPEEDKDELQATFSLMERILSAYPENRVKVFLYHPIPGTALYDYEKDRHLIEYPKTLEEWGKIHAHANQPWHSAKSLLLNYRNRDYVRKKSFYFWLTHLSPFLKSRKQTSRLKYLYELIYRIEKYRYEHDAFALPVEELLYKYLYPLILLRRTGFRRVR